MKELTEEQVKEIVDWLNTWDEIRDTVIPMRFKESFCKPLMLCGVTCSDKPTLKSKPISLKNMTMTFDGNTLKTYMGGKIHNIEFFENGELKIKTD
jgi:hypothetical protein